MSRYSIKPQPERNVRDVPPSIVTYIWNDPDVLGAKFLLLFLGVGELIFALPIWVLWGLRYIPSFPRSILYYAAIYYIVFIPIWFINIFLSQSRSKIVFAFGFFLNTFVWGVMSFVLSIILYQLITCALGQQPDISCRDTYAMDIIMLVLTAVLWIITFAIFCANTYIIGVIRTARPMVDTIITRN